jgi:PPOX class probable F420-dependent enzyme
MNRHSPLSMKKVFFKGEENMAPLLDLKKRRDAHIDQRLRQDPMAWLITVRPDGRPHSVIVWFLWDGETFLIFSRPNKQKLRNLQHNPNVLLSIDDTYLGRDPITIEGTGTLLSPDEVDTTLDAYVQKYGVMMMQLGLTPTTMAQIYSEPIRIVPTRVMKPFSDS